MWPPSMSSLKYPGSGGLRHFWLAARAMGKAHLGLASACSRGILARLGKAQERVAFEPVFNQPIRAEVRR